MNAGCTWCRRSDRLRSCRRCCSGFRWLSLCGSSLRSLVRFRGGFLIRKASKMFPHEFGVAQIERARMSLLLVDANFREIIDQDLGLDFELPCQLVDADLIRI